jgi:hypothetical protein
MQLEATKNLPEAMSGTAHFSRDFDPPHGSRAHGVTILNAAGEDSPQIDADLLG